MGDRRKLLSEVESRLDGRVVYWAGLRSDDIAPLMDLPNLAGSYSIIGGDTDPLPSLTYESLTRVRVDVDRWDIADHLSEEATTTFRDRLLQALSVESALLPYRSSSFLSAIQFARSSTCISLGMFGALQAAFEHKPWVEQQVAAEGIPIVPWTYVDDSEKAHADYLLRDGPVMLRRSRTSGGVGLFLAETAEELRRLWPHNPDGYIAVAPFLQDVLPLNIGATVWKDGVTTGHVSVQLIGVPECTDRRFGYCGNDFAATKSLDHHSLDLIENRTHVIGRLLGYFGYRGTFGVDFLLLRTGELLFTEVNPRFQGSTHVSAALSAEAGESCLFLDHVAAWLDIATPPRAHLRSVTRNQRSISHAVVHWPGPTAKVDSEELVASARDIGGFERADVTVPPGIAVEAGGVASRLTFDGHILEDGDSGTIREPVRTALGRWHDDYQARSLTT